MNSLVGYGVSSDSEAEEDGIGRAEQAEEAKDVKVEGEKKLRNFLLESGSASSSESEIEDEDEEEDEPAVQGSSNTCSSTEVLLHPSINTACHRLPPPPLGPRGSGVLPAGGSVFANPFKQKAEESLNVLCKHVPLTLQPRPAQIGGKRMCVAYRKDGRCRFGSRCKFAHDSDLQGGTGLPPEPALSEKGHADQAASRDSRSFPERGGEEDDENHRRKKQRVGLSDGLVPSKRALKLYASQRDRTSHS